jgi:serine/threonine protein kinase
VWPSTFRAPSFAALISAECSQIVHRDVKAQNVLLRMAEGCWDVCISDFGIATQLAGPWLLAHGRSSLLGSYPYPACTVCAMAGVAKAESLAYTVAQTGFKGTPASMSPEQLKVAALCPFLTMYIASGLG